MKESAPAWLYEMVHRAVEQRFHTDPNKIKLRITLNHEADKGDFTVYVFPLAGVLRQSPEDIGRALGEYLSSHFEEIERHEAVKGFLNIYLSPAAWRAQFYTIAQTPQYGHRPESGKLALVEYASPNTNKPLHLGHIRNIVLGVAISRILQSQGWRVRTTQVVNDRGIAICKSMLSWQRWGQGKGPNDYRPPIKGDKLVGDFYVLFSQKFEEEYEQWQQSEEAQRIYRQHGEGKDPKAFFRSYKNTYFQQHSPLARQAMEMLRAWEAGDLGVRALWQKLNAWVLEGIEQTFQRLDAHFDRVYYESEVYQLGKAYVLQGLKEGLFERQDDGAVVVDLSAQGLDRRVLLRKDGTSLYVTQDIGIAYLRQEEFQPDAMIYVVADEQEYHFQALFAILKLLGFPSAEGLYHLSYGMVELPHGRMKSREGTVVDADDLMDEVVHLARQESEGRGELKGLPEEEKEHIYEAIGMAALKYAILRVGAKKKMIFNPEESIDLQGQTGPYIQNAYVRICGVARKLGVSLDEDMGNDSTYEPVEVEIALIKQLLEYPRALQQSAEEYNPAVLANYLYQLARSFHRFYHEQPIVQAETEEARHFRWQLCRTTARIIKDGMYLLGMEVPERM